MAFNWTSLALTEIVPHFDAHSKEGEALVAMATLGVAAVGAIVLGAVARAQLGTGEQSVVPASKLSIRGFFEVITEFITKLANTVIGEHGIHFAPMFAAVFFFVLFNNLLGVIPGMTPATENLNTTLAFGVFIFLAYNFLGLRANGVSYLKHFLGPVWYLIPIMLIIEVISHLVRPISLSLRLANVLMGDHMVLGIFLDMAPAFVPIPFYVMGIFVCCLQAFVFTLLSMVYVGLATAHDH